MRVCLAQQLHFIQDPWIRLLHARSSGTERVRQEGRRAGRPEGDMGETDVSRKPERRPASSSTHLAEKPADADELHVDVVLRVGGPGVSGGVPEGNPFVFLRAAVARHLGLAGRAGYALGSLHLRAHLYILRWEGGGGASWGAATVDRTGEGGTWQKPACLHSRGGALNHLQTGKAK